MNPALLEYFSQHGIEARLTSRADWVLALVRINTPESLALAEELMGKPITRCPPAVPPWPPKPTSEVPGSVRVCKVVIPAPQMRRGQGMPRGELSAKTRRRLRKVRVGMSKGQLRAVGVTRRDTVRWTRMGLIQWSEG